MTWATSVPSLVFLGLSVLDFGPLLIRMGTRRYTNYLSSIVCTRQTDVRQNHRFMPRLRGRDIIMEVDAILLRYTVYNIGAKRFPYDLGDYRLALTVGSVKVMGQAPDNDTTGPTMLSTYAEYGNRPYVDALLELNPLDGNCSVRITVYVQSMRIVFDAVSLRCSHRVRQWHVVIATLMGAPAGFFFPGEGKR